MYTAARLCDGASCGCVARYFCCDVLGWVVMIRFGIIFITFRYITIKQVNTARYIVEQFIGNLACEWARLDQTLKQVNIFVFASLPEGDRD